MSRPKDNRAPVVSRRQMLRGALLGGGGIALRSLATGLSAAFLTEGIASAEPASTPTSLILNVAQAGDPLNVSSPGSMIGSLANQWASTHDADLAPTNVALGSKTVKAARPWSLLSADLRSRLAFVHHRTDGVAHSEIEKILRIYDAVRGAEGNGVEMLPSAIAQELATALGTVQREPMVLGSERVTFQGRYVENLGPADLKALFAGTGNASLDRFKQLRDQTLDKVYAQVKQNGTAAQRAYLDRVATSRAQAAKVGAELFSLLARVPFAETALGGLVAGMPIDDEYPTSPVDEIVTAVALLKLNLSPVVTLRIAFGGDNHNDVGLVRESIETKGGVALLQLLFDELKAAGIAERTTFASIATFGRTLLPRDGRGRAHNGGHHVMTLFGPKVTPGVAGGPVASGGDYAAGAFDSATGALGAGGDVKPEASFVVAGRTLMRAVGIPQDRVDVRLPGATHAKNIVG